MLRARDVSAPPQPSAEYLAEDRGTTLIVLSAVMAGLATLSVIGRFASRKLKGLQWGLDDWLTLFCLCLTWGLAGISIHLPSIGVGKHVELMTAENAVLFRQMLYAANLLYVPTPPLIKIAILWLYKRIFATRQFMMASYAVGGVLLLWCIAMELASIWLCRPIAGAWDPNVKAECFDFVNFSIAYAAINIVTDIIVLALPIPIILKLQLPPGRKVAIILVFSIGTFAVIATLVRLLSSLLYSGDPDVTWVYAPTFWWSVIEVCVGIICACLVTMRPLVPFLLPTALRQAFTSGSQTRSKTTKQYASGSSGNNWPAPAPYYEMNRLAGKSTATANRTGSSETDAVSEEQPVAGGIRVNTQVNVKVDGVDYV